MSKKVRIIERTMPDGMVEFTIQQKHFLFFWWWVDAWISNNTELPEFRLLLKEIKSII
jgi:hypothetical protein